jgi:hypothetical protein
VPSIGIGIGLNVRRGGGGLTSRKAATWFLASGEWDAAGFWRDGIPWDQDWFLASGAWDYLGVWDDAEAW